MSPNCLAARALPRMLRKRLGSLRSACSYSFKAAPGSLSSSSRSASSSRAGRTAAGVAGSECAVVLQVDALTLFQRGRQMERAATARSRES